MSCAETLWKGKICDGGEFVAGFDFDHTVGRKLMLASGTRSVILMVVDTADFDGSFPRKVVKLVSDTVEENVRALKEGKSGHSVHIVGLMRLDVEELSVESIYMTVLASPYLPLRMGKTENPSIGEKRVKELGKWLRKEFRVTGDSWDSSSVDIGAAGLGWFAGVRTHEGVDVFLPHRCQMFEVSGFTVSKIVSKADQAFNKSKRQHENERKQREPEGEIPAESSLSTVDLVSS